MLYSLLGGRELTRPRVRGLMIFILVIGVVLGFFVRSAQTQSRAVSAIRKAGGTVYYDWQWEGGPVRNPKSPWPKWLIDIAGVDCFSRVVRVFLVARNTDSNLMYYIGHLAQLEGLVLSGPFVTDSNLANLEGMSKLELLFINNSNISDKGLIYLQKLRTLEILSLSNTKISGNGLRHLKSLRNLKVLNIKDTNINNSAIIHLQNAIPDLHISGYELGDEKGERGRGVHVGKPGRQ